MGTTYSIQVVDTRLSPAERREWHEEIDALLEDLNRQMSVHRPDSEISAFNRHASMEPMEVSAGFRHVVARALELAERTGGAFDPTLGPLVRLWGFGPDGPGDGHPTPEAIADARRKTGYRHLSLTEDGRLMKHLPELELDLGGIAKGYGVDRVADLLRAHGATRFLVEIGGEVLAEGTNVRGEPWRIGVQRPVVGPATDAGFQSIVPLTDGRALATSGDYRQFRHATDGRILSHIIAPRTGEPAGMATASVTVWAGDALTADALATALVVLGPGEGLPLLAASFPEVEALFILRRADGAFDTTATPGFPAPTSAGGAARHEHGCPAPPH